MFSTMVVFSEYSRFLLRQVRLKSLNYPVGLLCLWMLFNQCYGKWLDCVHLFFLFSFRGVISNYSGQQQILIWDIFMCPEMYC